jgi:2-polyprenyl-3-methyl-5-hydroxy-6-metoxy-1,4-benzoquinol methylase
VGCGDATGTRIVLQNVGHVHGVDFEPLVLNDAVERYRREGVSNASFSIHDMIAGPCSGDFEGAYSLDVIEHIPQEKEATFLDNICRSLNQHGVLILGTPNITALEHASAESHAGHVNLKTVSTLHTLLSTRFHNVFVFSMNDEVVHTGFYPMAHYLIGMGVGIRTLCAGTSETKSG